VVIALILVVGWVVIPIWWESRLADNL